MDHANLVHQGTNLMLDRVLKDLQACLSCLNDSSLRFASSESVICWIAFCSWPPLENLCTQQEAKQTSIVKRAGQSYVAAFVIMSGKQA
jgi:hypothetical protein